LKRLVVRRLNAASLKSRTYDKLRLLLHVSCLQERNQTLKILVPTVRIFGLIDLASSPA